MILRMWPCECTGPHHQACPCRQSGTIDNECMDRLARRVESLDEPSWFIEYKRPDRYPSVAKDGFPHPPFTIVGVGAASVAEDVYFSRVRPQQLYCTAYGLAHVDDAVDAGPTVVRDASGAVLHVCCRRVERFFWQCATPTPSSLYAAMLPVVKTSLTVFAEAAIPDMTASAWRAAPTGTVRWLLR